MLEDKVYAEIPLKNGVPFLDAVVSSGWATSYANVSQQRPLNGYQAGLFGNAIGALRAQTIVAQDEEG
eukprot:12908893-Prorocentrum_lima.AAC.1